MLTLYAFPPAFGQFSASPFCVKAAALLQVAKVDWTRKDMLDSRKMPHRKLPVLMTPDGLVPDSDNIRGYLEKRGAEFDPGLSDPQKAHARALAHMSEQHLYFHLIRDRWANDANWTVLRDMFFGGIPAPLRGIISNSVRKGVLKGIDFQGTLRFSDAEHQDRVVADFQVLEALLAQSPFLLGDGLSSADISVAPMVEGFRSSPVPTALSQRVSDSAVLCEYLDRFKTEIALP